MATVTLTTKSKGEIILIANTLAGLVAGMGGNENVAPGVTVTVTDASPSVITVGSKTVSI
jgi:hypothetical protein